MLPPASHKAFVMKQTMGPKRKTKAKTKTKTKTKNPLHILPPVSHILGLPHVIIPSSKYGRQKFTPSYMVPPPPTGRLQWNKDVCGRGYAPSYVFYIVLIIFVQLFPFLSEMDHRFATLSIFPILFASALRAMQH